MCAADAYDTYFHLIIPPISFEKSSTYLMHLSINIPYRLDINIVLISDLIEFGCSIHGRGGRERSERNF